MSTKIYRYIVITLLTFVSISSYAYAASTAKLYIIPVNCYDECPDEGIELYRFWGNLDLSIVKDTYFKRNDTGENLTSNFTLNANKSVTFHEKKTFGIWYVEGGSYDSPQADGILYNLNAEPQTQKVTSTPIWFGVSVPNDSDSVPVITSQNPGIVSCTTAGVCTAKSEGTATIKIAFPNKTQTSTHPFLGNTSGHGKVKMSYAYGDRDLNYSMKAYSFSSIYYTVTVPPVPNDPHTVTCLSPNGTTETSTNARWTYSDPDGDPQQNYQVQLSLNSNFATIAKTVTVTAPGDVSGVRNVLVSGLTPDTTYFIRVRSYNANNGWSAYGTCASSFVTTGNQPHSVNIGPTNLITWSSAKPTWWYSDPENDPQTKYQVQLSKVSDFSYVPHTVLNETNVASIREHTFTELDSDTTYYVRVRAYNDKNGWSAYQTTSFKTAVNTSPLTLSCAYTGNPYIDTPLTYDSTISGGSSPYSYYWSGTDISGVVSTSSSVFLKTYPTTGSKSITLSATDSNGVTGMGYCGANITCNPSDKPADDQVCSDSNERTVYICGVNGWEASTTGCYDSSAASFNFNPYIADSNGQCNLELSATGVSKCTVKKGTTFAQDYLADAEYKISYIRSSGIKLNTGSYTLWCTPADITLPEKMWGTKSCITNPGTKEN